jgi:AbiU2
MEINVRDGSQFHSLLVALIDELIDAREHFRLQRALNSTITEYQAEYNQSAAFWSLTLSAHMDAALIRLCRAYDLYEGKPSLNLRNLLDTIKVNLHFFDEPNFRKRLKGNAFVDSLASHPRRPDPAQLEQDLRSVSVADPLVKKLIVLRNNFLAHRSRSSAIEAVSFGQQNTILFSEIFAGTKCRKRTITSHSRHCFHLASSRRFRTRDTQWCSRL